MTSRPPEGEQAFLLSAQLGWRSGQTRDGKALPTQGIATGDKLCMVADPQGPLALDSADGSLGRLRLPRRMALDADLTLYLMVTTPYLFAGVSTHDNAILRFDAVAQRFERLPEVGGWARDADELLDARRFHTDSAIEILGKALYVADPVSGRVQVFDLATLALTDVWGPWHAPWQPVRAGKEQWRPVDMAASAQHVFILDGAQGRIYSHKPGSDALKLIIDVAQSQNALWTRIAVDRDERLYLYNESSRLLDIFAFDERRGWGLVATADDVNDVRAKFDSPSITVEQRPGQNQVAWFALPSCLRRLVCRQLPHQADPSVDKTCDPSTPGDLYFAFATGEPIDLALVERIGLARYRRSGAWVSSALDSAIYRCQWHRILLEISHLPSGSMVEVWTYASADQQADEAISQIPDESWQRAIAVVGAMQADASLVISLNRDGLVQSREGQYLWLRVCLRSDGFDTPEITSIRVLFPRHSFLKYLPAVFSQDEESRWFLERYLSIIQSEWDDLERKIRESARYFDPQAVPGGAPLEYLASWLALPLEGEWTDEQKRRLLVGARGVYRQRGTLQGLKAWLQIYLYNLSEVSPEDQNEIGIPVLLESYRARDLALIDDPHQDESSEQSTAELQAAFRLGTAPSLWSDQAANRLQLGVNSQEGEAQIVSMGDPKTDVLSLFAHRFDVYVPAAWVRSAADERMLRRALDIEKPAHTQYELHLVEPRFRVGVQAMLDVDAIVGGFPTPQPLQDESGEGSDLPPSQEPHGRLGYDILLEQSASGISSAYSNAPHLGLNTTLS